MTFQGFWRGAGRRPRVVAGLLAGLPVVLAASLAGWSREASPEYIYVCVQGEAKVAVIDVAKREVDTIIDLTQLGFSPNAKPHNGAVEADGSHWYVTLIGDNRVVKFGRDNKIVAQREMEVPGLIALHPNGGTMAISRSMSAVNPPQRIGVGDRESLEGDEIGVFFPRPHPMVVSKKGIAYTGSLGVNQIAAVDLAEKGVELTDIEGPPHALVQFALSPDERTMVATTELTGKLLVFDLADPMKPALVREIELGPKVFHPVYTPDGSFVWAPVKGANEIAIVDAKSWTVAHRLKDPSFRQPHQIAFSADGSTAFLTNNNSMDHMAGGDSHEMEPAELVILDVAERRVVKTIELGKNLTGIGSRVRK